MTWYNTIFIPNGFSVSMPDWITRARPWINALLVLLLLLPIARLAWRFIAPPEPAVSAVPVSTNTAAGAPVRQTIDVAQLRQAALFGQSTAAGNNGETPESTLPLKLQGVIAAGNSPGAAAVFEAGEPKARAARVGMALQPGVVLKAVFKDRVIIDNNGREEKITLQTPPAIMIGGPPPEGSQPAYPPGIDPVDQPPGFAPQPMDQTSPGGVPPSGMPPGFNPTAQQQYTPQSVAPNAQQYSTPQVPPGGYSTYSGGANPAPQPPHMYRR